MLGSMAFAVSVLAAATVRAQGYALADSQALQVAVETVRRQWEVGAGGYYTCPGTAVPITEAECEAVAMMSTPMAFKSDEFVGAPVFYAPFPTTTGDYPKGCSVYDKYGFTVFHYDNHSTGAAAFTAGMGSSVCKNDPWVMYKSACPTGKVSISESECINFAQDKGYQHNPGTISSAVYPPGCFGVGRVPGLTSIPTSEVGQVFFNILPTGSLTNAQAYPACKDAAPVPMGSPTGSPTGPPTGPPTGSTTGSTTAAVGDPHMTNIFGHKFDIVHAGPHTLVHIPQGADAADTLLRVHAQVRHEGDKCSDMYIKVLNISGVWAEGRRHGGFSFVTESPGGGQMVAPLVGAAEWTSLGMVDLKVVRGTTGNGVLYLNMYARHLRPASKQYSIGGILGLDDYTEAATPEAGCEKKTLSLLSARERGAQAWA